MIYAQQLVRQALGKLEMARELEPALAEDIELAVGCLWAGLCRVGAGAALAARDKAGSGERGAGKPEGQGTKDKPGDGDDFSGCHTHD